MDCLINTPYLRKKIGVFYSKLSGRKGVFALVLLASFAFLVGWILWQFFSINSGMEINRIDTEASRFASRLFFEKMTALAQLAVALLGGTWAFLTLAGTKVIIEDWPTKMCFWLANLSLAFSLIVYWWGYDFLTARIFYHAGFDIDAPVVGFVGSSQQLLFIKGCFDLVITIIFGHKQS